MQYLVKLRQLAAAMAVAGVAIAVGASSSVAATGRAAASKLHVTFVTALVNDSYFVTIKCGAQAEAKKLGINFTWTGPASNDVSAEIQAFQAASLTNPDGMILAPFSNTGFSGIIGPLMKRGIPVIASGQKLTPQDTLGTFITNFLTAGNSLAPEIGKLTGGTGTMAIVADTTGNTTDSDRYTGLVPILKRKYPKLTVLSPQYAQNSSAKAAQVTSSLISGNPGLKLVYASSGPEAVGAASAIAAAHMIGKIKLISFDSSPQQITLLKRHQLAATVAQSPFLDGKLTVQAVVSYLRQHPGHKPVKATTHVTFTPQKLLTPANINSALAKKYQYLTNCAHAPSV